MNRKIKNLIKNNINWLILIIIAVSFFIGISYYNFSTQANNFIKWSSPDETANYVFTKLYGQTGELTIFEKYNLQVDNIIHPRSFRSISGSLQPVSFLGIILIYGFLISLTSVKILPFLTPLVAAIGIIFYYLFIKKIFGRVNALISSLLLGVFPVYIYYSVRSMFHNILFIVLLILGFYFSLFMIRQSRIKIKTLNLRFIFRKYLPLICAALSGGFFGLAIITRSSELLWLAPVLLIAWIINIKKIGLLKLLIFLGFLFLAILPSLYWDQILYNSPIKGGYPEMNQAIINMSKAGSNLIKSTFLGELRENHKNAQIIKDNIFHFGFNAKQSLKMLYYYFTKMFPWLFWAAFLGAFLFLQKIHKWKKRHLTYILNYSIIFIILVFYYGSWQFFDNPDKASHTIGNSYTRYWLPIYLGAMPFASLFLIRASRVIFAFRKKQSVLIPTEKNNRIGYYKNILSKNIKWPSKKFLVNSLRVIVIAIIYFISIQFVAFGSEEGIIYSVVKGKTAKIEYEKVIELTENSSVIITQYHDKLFFPERKVIVGLFNDSEMNKRYAKLVNYLPVYYYNFTFPQKDIEYLNTKKLKEVGLGIRKIEQITSDFTLYKLSKVIN